MSDLLSKKVKVAGRTITVFKAAFVNGLQRSIRIAEAGEETPAKIYDNLDEQVVRYVHNLLFPSLISCSEGKLPTEAEFLKLSDEEVNAWIDAASSFNPDWFSLNGEAAKKDMEKKQSPQS